MRTPGIIPCSITLCWLGAGAALAETYRWSFHGDASGSAPAGFTAARTGQGAEGESIVREEADAPSGAKAVEQASTDRTSYRFPVLVASEPRAKNGILSVPFKAVSGRVDQTGGLVWRYLDENNYYVVRANALEDNVVLYKESAFVLDFINR